MGGGRTHEGHVHDDEDVMALRGRRNRERATMTASVCEICLVVVDASQWTGLLGGLKFIKSQRVLPSLLRGELSQPTARLAPDSD
jgi:hypothetical protein